MTLIRVKAYQEEELFINRCLGNILTWYSGKMTGAIQSSEHVKSSVIQRPPSTVLQILYHLDMYSL